MQLYIALSVVKSMNKLAMIPLKYSKTKSPEFEIITTFDVQGANGAIYCENIGSSEAELICKAVNNFDEIIETIARNCIAWDTSKDKREGLLPEVAVFTNRSLYKKLTGEEYNFSKVCKKYHIDN